MSVKVRENVKLKSLEKLCKREDVKVRACNLLELARRLQSPIFDKQKNTK